KRIPHRVWLQEVRPLPHPRAALRRPTELGPTRHHHTPLNSEEPMNSLVVTSVGCLLGPVRPKPGNPRRVGVGVSHSGRLTRQSETILDSSGPSAMARLSRRKPLPRRVSSRHDECVGFWIVAGIVVTLL